MQDAKYIYILEINAYEHTNPKKELTYVYSGHILQITHIINIVKLYLQPSFMT